MGMKESEISKINPMIYLGRTGHLRASHQAIDVFLLKPHWPMHSHTSEKSVTSGDIVRLEMGEWYDTSGRVV